MKEIIFNTNAGRGYSKKIHSRLLDYFSKNFNNYNISYTKGPHHATDLAISAIKHGAREIISIGGDGTALEVLAGTHKQEVVFSVFPAGTGNDLVKSLGFSTQLDEFLKQYNSKRVDVVDVAVSNYSPFFSICGLGFVTDVLERVNKDQNSLIKGPLAFPNAIFQSLKAVSSSKLFFEIDGLNIERDVMLAAVINSPYSGGGMKFVPYAKPFDSKLHLFLVKQISKLELLKVFPKVYSGKHLNHKAVEIISGKMIKINSNERMMTNFDGNVFGHTPLEIELSDIKQKVVVGPHYREENF
ncbi:MAG: diacylglycerol/lipid kinase family protein [Clostridia bacterium]